MSINLSSPVGLQKLGQSTSASPTTTPSGEDTYKWILAWVVFLVLLGVVAQTETGYRIVYYTLVLVLLLLVVTQAKAIVTSLAPVGTEIPS